MNKYISDLISRGEHQKQDFKYEINDARKIARTIVAFSNTDGGKLLIGVKDNGKIAGVHSEEEYYMIEAAASLYCRPEINFKIKKWEIQGKTILEVDIPKGADKPYQAKTDDNRWLSYIRVKDQNILTNSIQIRVWKNQKKRKAIFIKFTETEQKLLEYLQTNDISISQFINISGLSRKKASDILVRLISLGIVEINYNDKEITYKVADL